MTTDDEQPKVAHYTRTSRTRNEPPPRTQAEQLGAIIRDVPGATPHERLLHEMLSATAEHELATARARIRAVGQALRDGEDVVDVPVMIFEAMLAEMPVEEIAHELNYSEGELREIERSYAWHTWVVEMLRNGQWQQEAVDEEIWHRERVAECAAEALDDTLDGAADHARVRVWVGSNPERTGPPAHVAYTHDQDAD